MSSFTRTVIRRFELDGHHRWCHAHRPTIVCRTLSGLAFEGEIGILSVSGDVALVPHQAVMTRAVEGELVLLQTNTELYFGLDPVGTAMWDAVCSEGTLDGAHHALCGAFDVDPARLRADLVDLVGRLLDNGLLVSHGG